MTGARRRAEHLAMVRRAEAGTLSAVERVALGVLLDRVLLALELEDDDPAGELPPAWARIVEAYRCLVPTTSTPRPCTPDEGVRGADVRPLRAR